MTLISSLYRFAVILILCVLAMIGGFIFKRFIQGAKGWEQIPLLSWFKEFGNLQAVSGSINNYIRGKIVSYKIRILFCTSAVLSFTCFLVSILLFNIVLIYL